METDINTDYKFKIKEGKYFVKDFNNKYEISIDKRIFNFVIRVIKYLKNIQKSEINRVIIYQLTKSVTSTGANYEEAQGGSSRKDFLAKISISHREAKETNYWLRIIKDSEIDNSGELNDLIQESLEIRNILGSIVGKVRRSKK